MGERSPSPGGIGILSVFTVLLVLILAVFSVLTLSAAQADLALSRRAAETVAAYYGGETLTPAPAPEGGDHLPVWDGTLPG